MERVCPTCQHPLTSNTPHCDSCGGAVSDANPLASDEQLSAALSPTLIAPIDAPPSTATPRDVVAPPQPTSTTPPQSTGGIPSSAGTARGTRYPSGTILLNRYRVVGQLGEGGMGAVYRADDLQLGESVALKFLPSVQHGSAELERLRAEVRMARLIAHPNVCRVYDIGEVEGHPFLSMEFVDGEDLAALLRRIGRLPADKGVEIARQLCAGLSAAHERGILHRDLKPANIMLDGRGQVRIADFGIASDSESNVDSGRIVGTPAYMAPETLRGQPHSRQSDLYSLGLVLYEIFTGRRAVAGETLREILAQHERGPFAPLSTYVPDIDFRVERVISSCLEHDPMLRPSNALSIAAQLPGADPLADALAAGETPSPELVRIVGGSGRLRRSIALILVAIVAATLVALAGVAPQQRQFEVSPLPLSPEVLAHKAREQLTTLGYPTPPQDRAWGLEPSYWWSVCASIVDERRWEPLRRGTVPGYYFWYRESKRRLIPVTGSKGLVDPHSPRFERPGMIRVQLTPTGDLSSLRAIPSPNFHSNPEPFSWDLLFASARLEFERFIEVQPLVVPLEAPTDEVHSWVGPHPSVEGVEIRVNAASYGGQLVSFSTQINFDNFRKPTAARRAWAQVQDITGTALVFISLIGGLWVGWRNFRRGRGDRRGALTLAVFYVCASMVSWMLRADHVGGLAEFSLFQDALATALYHGFIVWLLYMALEPTIRQHWPRRLGAWNRLLGGAWHDPMVGRDILVGFAAASLAVLLQSLHYFVADLWGPPPQPFAVNAELLLSGRRLLSEIILHHADAVNAGLLACFLFVLYRRATRNVWVAATLLFLTGLARIPLALQSDNLFLDIAFHALTPLLMLATLFRYGLLAFVAAVGLFQLFERAPLSLDTDAWYAGHSCFTMGWVIGLTLIAFFANQKGTPMKGCGAEC